MKLALNDVTITYGTHAAVQHVTMAIPEKSFFLPCSAHQGVASQPLCGRLLVLTP